MHKKGAKKVEEVKHKKSEDDPLKATEHARAMAKGTLANKVLVQKMPTHALKEHSPSGPAPMQVMDGIEYR